MTVLTWTGSTKPTGASLVNITMRPTTYYPEARHDNMMSGFVTRVLNATGIDGAPFNGGTYGPAKGGTTVASNVKFLWNGMTVP